MLSQNVTKCLPGLGCTVGKLMLPSWCITQMPIPVSAGTFQPRHTWAKQWISHQLCSRLNLHWNHGIDPCNQKPRYPYKPTGSNFSWALADIQRPWRSLIVTTEPVLRDKIHGVAAKLDEFPFGNIFQHIEEMSGCEIVAGNTEIRTKTLGAFYKWYKTSQDKVLTAGWWQHHHWNWFYWQSVSDYKYLFKVKFLGQFAAFLQLFCESTKRNSF